MGVAVATTEEVGDSAVLAVAPMGAQPVMATVEPALAMLAAATERGTTHPGSQRDATAATDTMRREARLEVRFMALIRGIQVELLPGSLLGRQIIQVATTSLEINPRSALRIVNPVCNPVIIRAAIPICADRPQRVCGMQRGMRTTGHGRI
jgi:hypothetical protein